MAILAQKIEKKYKDSVLLAAKYYSIMVVLNELNISAMEIDMLAYTAVMGNISSRRMKEGFEGVFGYSKSSIIQTMYRLLKKGMLIKRDKKVVVHPSLFFDFSCDFIIQLKMTHELQHENSQQEY